MNSRSNTCPRCKKPKSTFVTCDSCDKRWCLGCATRFARTCGIHLPEANYDPVRGKLNPKYLVFRCNPCANNPKNYGPLRLGDK